MFVDESQQTIQLQRKWKNTSIAIKNISRTEYLIEKDKAFLRLVYIVNDSKDTRDNNSSITSFSSSHATTCTSSVLSPTRTTPKIQVRSILLRTKNQTDAIFWSSWLSHMKMTTALKPSYFSQHGW
jgi:hypothetical protein